MERPRRGLWRSRDLSRQSLRPDMYFYVAPARNPGVEAVYVDRVVLIRDLAR